MLGTITRVLLHAYGLTDKGRIRPTNEDCFAIHEDLGLCVIADGMGGHNAGEVAARLAVDAVVDFVRSAEAGSLPSAKASLRQTSGPAGERDDPGQWPFGYDDS